MQPSGFDDSHQNLRNQRWTRLCDMHNDLVEELADRESVLGLQMGYLNGVGNHSIGLAIALHHSQHAELTGLIPSELLDRTKDERLRLVEDSRSSVAPIRVFGFALPKLTTEAELVYEK